MSESFDLTDLTGFAAGTVGPAGERTFYLQAVSSAGELVSLKVEKQQVQALATAVDELMEKAEVEAEPARVPELIEPVIEAWTVGALGVGYDDANHRVVIVGQELAEDAEPAEARFHLTPEQARGFVDHAVFLVEYGRDFGRQNGHKPH